MAAELQTGADLVLGTAGHIDHGKSTLVRALTGVDPDRLEEERRRGITIELGFARLTLPDGTTLGVVDVPGHEKFVRQMIAGATGIDLGLLCIAADDGIMPQTEEHLAVLELLGIPSIVVALTKIDLADEDWTELVRADIEERLESTPYAGAPIIGVSGRTGEGLDELRAALQAAAHATKRVKAGSRLRYPVDRVFTAHGSGTVVTGTLWSGVAHIGDRVEIQPGGAVGRIRGIQIHDTPQDVAYAGHRVAFNLSGISTDDVHPGDFMATPGTVRASFRFDADFTYLDTTASHGKPFENGTRVHVAHGSKEVIGRLFFLGDRTSLESGQRAFAQLRLEEPLPVMWRDRFVVRSYSPVHVIGGGVVLRAQVRRSTTVSAEDLALLEALRTGDEAGAVQAAFDAQSVPVQAAEVAAALGLEEADVAAELEALAAAGKAIRLTPKGGRIFFTTEAARAKACAALDEALVAFHRESPTEIGIVKEALRQRAVPKMDADCFELLLAYAAGRGSILVKDGRVSHPVAGAAAVKLEEEACERLFGILEGSGATPQTIYQIVEGSGLEGPVAYRALGILEKQGRIVKVDADYYFEARVVEACEAAVRKRLADGPAGAAELRDLMATNRKCAIVLLEYFDARGITARVGDERVLKQ